jgi:two-component system invasion response regulator UvrY
LARIYLVDDHAVLREAMCGLLAENGHLVVGQSDDPMVAAMEIRQLLPDLILLDLKLGLRSGFELMAELQRRAVKVKTIVATMSAHARDVAEALRYGAEAYVLKGSTAAEWMRAIDAVMKGQRHYEGKVAELAIDAFMAPDHNAALESLSARERQVIVQVVNGRSSMEIGADLHLSPKTVDSYRSRLMAKLGVRDVQGLVRFAVRTGLISADEL